VAEDFSLSPIQWSVAVLPGLSLMSQSMRNTDGPRWFRPSGRMVPRLILTLALFPGGTAGAQSHPPDLGKLHALLVVDTLSGLGESVKVDGENIDHLLSSRLPRDRADIVVLTGKDVTATAILSYYRGLNVGPNDALLFYYAGHGATDAKQGHFMALQDLAAQPLLRSDLKKAMQQKQPSLIVILTDCCSTSFHLPGKTRRVFADKGTAATVDPLLRCLLYQSRGVVDITAASGNASFGDDHEGGIFTRTFAKLVADGTAGSDGNNDGFVTWSEFFGRLQARTQGVFVTWAQHQRARGEDVDQTSQKPMAFSLGTAADASAVVGLHNATASALAYEYRWAGTTSWQNGQIAPRAVAEHAAPAGAGHHPQVLEVRFDGGKTSRLQPGKTYYFHDTKDRPEHDIHHP
jgi:Caspase domain